jgi:glycolate oxidase FAD binding subunit
VDLAVLTERVAVDAYDVNGVRPARVVRPTSAQEVADAIVAANADRTAIVLFGGGTRCEIGDAPSRYDIALDLRGVRGVVEHAPADLVCTVRAGTTLAELGAELAAKGQRWPIDAAEPERATVGGTIASAAATPSRLRHQHVRDWVIGCEAVLGDGTRARAGGRVVKNVTGYDLTRLYSGSFGTLAALVEVSLKLVAVDERTRLFVLRDSDVPRLLTLAGELRAALPLDSLVVAAGAPGRGAGLFARIAGSAAAVERLAREVSARAAFVEVDASELQRVVDATTRFADVARASLAPGTERRAMSGDAVAYIGTGTTFLVGERSDEELRATRGEVEAEGGALVLERIAPDRRRALGTWGTLRAPVAIQRALKQRFDPNGVLAPGRFPA